ncbi:MAG: H-NS histone family protein [Burkholderiaceae bacterium]|nr:H-NS histone family protein [Roseateles sp.]MBV8470129.1 H-NS histone family protein [Burkholderiaceae bacterium]
MSTLQDLLAQRAALEKQIFETQNRERTEAINKIQTLMSEYGLTVADLESRKPKAAKTAKVAAKYVNKATGESWTGRGLQPKWLKAALGAGAKLEDFAV